MTNLKVVRPLDHSQGLLNAAGKLFRRKGYASTTVREIATAAGILPGSLHYRYPTKESLLLSLMDRGIGSAVAAVRAAIASSPDPIERLRRAVKAHLHLLVCGDDAIYVLLYEGKELTGEARASMVRLRDRYDALWEGILYQVAGTGRLRPEIDPKLMRFLILGTINWVPQWYSQEGDRTLDEIADAFAANFLFGLLVERDSSARNVKQSDGADDPENQEGQNRP